MSTTPGKTKPGSSAKPGPTKPDTTKPETAKPETAEPGGTTAGGNKPDKPGTGQTGPDDGDGATATAEETGGTTDPAPEGGTGTDQTQAVVDGLGSLMGALPGGEEAGGAADKPMPQIALVLKAIDQRELRDFHAEYSSSTAVARTYRPQGFFGLTPAMLERLPAGTFIEVDTDDEFWRLYEVNVHGPSAGDQKVLGLRSAAVQVDYCAANRRKRVTKTLEFITGTDAVGTAKMFSTPMIPGVYTYDATVTYAFDESWTGAARPRSVSVAGTDLRTLYVLPQRDFRFVVVNASFTRPPDWTEMSQIHAQITCRSLSETQPEEFVHHVVIHEGWTPSLTAESGTAGPLPWRIRFNDPDAPVQITYALSYVPRKGLRHDADSIVTVNPNLVFQPSP